MSVAALILCIAVLLAWTLGVTVSDRFVWSQFLAWLPSVVILPGAAVLWVGAAILARVGRAKVAGRMSIGAGAWLVIASVYVMAWDLRVYRLPLPARPGETHVRVLHWNVTAIERMEQITVPVLAQKPDVAVLVNPHSHAGWMQFPAAIGPEFRVLNIGGVVIASRVPVARYGMLWLGLEGLPPEMEPTLPRRSGWVDPGRALFIELETGVVLGRPTVLWILDLPSEPRLSRWKHAIDAAGKIRAWSGPVRELQVDGSFRAGEGTGFPTPDVVVGDFNTSRSAASLSRLLPGMRNAFDEGGAGYAATWPRYGYRTPIPLVHIDQMFVGAGMTALRYEVVDPGFGYHQMQVGDIAGK